MGAGGGSAEGAEGAAAPPFIIIRKFMIKAFNVSSYGASLSQRP